MSVIGWLLDGDPAIGWQVLRDLVNAPAGEVAAGRARVEHDGWARACSRSRIPTGSGTAARASRRPALAGRVHFDLEGGAGTPSRWNTLRALRVLKWWDGIA